LRVKVKVKGEVKVEVGVEVGVKGCVYVSTAVGPVE